MSTYSLFAMTSRPLDPSRLVAAVQAEADREGGRPGTAGGLATFIGAVRGWNQGHAVLRLEYDAYEPLALKMFRRIADESRECWPGAVLGLHHRVGSLAPGDVSVVVVAAAPHRGDAFGACRFAIERLKQVAPIWKREYFDSGDVWLEGATADPDDAEARQEARRRACA